MLGQRWLQDLLTSLRQFRIQVRQEGNEEQVSTERGRPGLAPRVLRRIQGRSPPSYQVLEVPYVLELVHQKMQLLRMSLRLLIKELII